MYLSGDCSHLISVFVLFCSNSSPANPSYGSGRLVEAKTSPTMSAPAASLGGLSLVLLLNAEVQLTPRSLPQTMQLFVNNVGIIVCTDETTGWLTILLVHERKPLQFCITSKQASYLTPLVPVQGDLVRVIKGKYVGKMGRLLSVTENKVEAIIEFNTGEMIMARMDQVIKLNPSYTNSTYSSPSNRPATLPISGDSHMITQSSPMAPATSTNTCVNNYSQTGHMTLHTSPTDTMPTNHMTTHNHSSNLCVAEPSQLAAQNDASQNYSSSHHMTIDVTSTAQGCVSDPGSHMTTQGCMNGAHTAQVCAGNGDHVTTPIPSPMSSYQRSPYTNNCMSPTSPWGNSHQHVTTPSPYGPQVLSPVSPASSVCDMGTEQYDMPNPSTTANWAVGYTNPTQSLTSNGVYANGTCKSFLQPPHFVYIPTTITSCNAGALPTTPGTAQWPTATCGGVTATFGPDGKAYYGTPPPYVDHRTAVQYMLAAQVRNMHSGNTKPAYRHYAPPTTYAQIQSLRSPQLTYGTSPFMSLPAHLTPKTPSAATTTPATPQQSCPQASSKTEPKSTICEELKSLLCMNKCDDPYNKGMMLIKKNGVDFVINKLLDKLETLEAPPNWYDPLSKNGEDITLLTCMYMYNVHVYMYVCMYVCTLCMYVCMYVCTCMYVMCYATPILMGIDW